MPGIMEPSTQAPIYTYSIASGDMRYIEINQRQIFLRQHPNLGLILRGELPGCGESCYADLSQVLLEYAMTCEGCKTLQEAKENVAEFGSHLGEILAHRLAPMLLVQEPGDRLFSAFEFLLNSMAAQFKTKRSQEQVLFTLDFCPLCHSGKRHGLGRDLAMARHGFVVLCQSMLHALAPGWILRSPSINDTEQDLLEVLLVKKPG